MKIAKIYIVGQIGNSYNDDGTIATKGVELQDVIEQVAINKDAEGYETYITSLGGSVRVGKLIAKYIGSLPNNTTIARRECASMGTEIHLAVPVANRKIEAGTDYFIHNPLMQGVSGNAAELTELAEMIKESEVEMLKMYVNATGLSKDAVSGLMNQETSLTSEQCLSMGFVSEVLPAQELKAVAFFDKPKTNTIIDMGKVETFIDKAIAKAFGGLRKDLKIGSVETQAELDAEKAAADLLAAGGVDFTVAEGVLHLESTEVGAVATIEGQPVHEGSYTAGDGTVITIDAESKVVEVKAVEADEVATLKAEIETLKKQNEEANAEFEAKLATEIDALKSQIGSSFVPKQAAAVFTKKKDEPKSIVADAADRKKLYKPIKA